MSSDPKAFADLARKCKVSGLGSFSRLQRKHFRTLLKKELRKKTFEPKSSKPREVLAEFCDHVIQEFDASAIPVIVTDHLPYLRNRAKRLSHHTVPLAALILYAAWIEHWTNMILSVAMQRNGAKPIAAKTFLKSQPPFKTKLNRVATELGGSGIPQSLRSGLIQLVVTRNQHLHYQWRGVPIAQADTEMRQLCSIVARAETILKEATDFEYDKFDAPHMNLVAKVFRVR